MYFTHLIHKLRKDSAFRKRFILIGSSGLLIIAATLFAIRGTDMSASVINLAPSKNGIKSIAVNAMIQTFPPALAQMNGTTATVGQLRFRTFNNPVSMKDITLSVNGYLPAASPYSEVKLQDNGTVLATFIQSGNGLFATNINTTIAANMTKTYDIVATLKNATTSADLGSSFKIVLSSSRFENITDGSMISASPMNIVVSPIFTMIKAKPIINYVSSQKGAEAIYTFNIAAQAGDINIDTLKIAVDVNTDMNNSTATLWLGNEGGTAVGTAPITSMTSPTNPLAFTNLSNTTTIANGSSQDFTLTFPVSNRYQGANPGNITIEMSNISYNDVFQDATQALHPNMFDTFQALLAPGSTFAILQ